MPRCAWRARANSAHIAGQSTDRARTSRFSALPCSAWWVKLNEPVITTSPSRIMTLLWAWAWTASVHSGMPASWRLWASEYSSVVCSLSRRTFTRTPRLWASSRALRDRGGGETIGLNEDGVPGGADFPHHGVGAAAAGREVDLDRRQPARQRIVDPQAPHHPECQKDRHEQCPASHGDSPLELDHIAGGDR